MLVLTVDRLGKRRPQALRTLPSEHKFAATVFSGFAAALLLFAVLFTLSGDPAQVRALTDGPATAAIEAPVGSLGDQGTALAP